MGTVHAQTTEEHGAPESSEADTLYEKAKTYWEQGRYEDAMPLAKRALALREEARGPAHPDVAASLGMLAVLYQARGEYERAEPLHRRALAILEKALGPDHARVAFFLLNLATLYRVRGEYERAEPLFRRALAIQEKALGPDHPHVARSLNNLAGLHWERGEYERAEPLYRRALAIFEKALGSEHPDVAIPLTNLANLYRDRGEYERAEPLYRRALAISEKALGPGHPLVATSLTNLATLHSARKEPGQAEPLHRRALAIREKALGPDHPFVATSLTNLADVYQARGESGQAEPLHRRALAIWEKALGPDHPHVASSLHNLASLYSARGEYERAELLQKRALAIQEKALGPDHPLVATFLDALAALYGAWDRKELALAFRERNVSTRERSLDVLLATGSESQKLARIATVQEETEQIIAFHVQSARDDPRAARLALETILRRKGRVLDATAGAIQALRQQLGEESRGVLDELARVRSALATSLLRGPAHDPGAYRARNQELQERVEALEAELSQRSRRYREAARPVTLAAVQAQLPARAALVELILYRPYDSHARGPEKNRWGAPRYVAYVLPAQGPARAVDVGEAASIDALVAQWRAALQTRHADARAPARALDARVMAPVRALLGDGDIQQVFLAPDGDLALIPFAALVDETGHYLVERFQITYLTSGRDLLRHGAPESAQHAPLVVANPAFDTAASHAPEASQTASLTRGPASATRDLLGLVVKPLPATAEEAEALAMRLADVELWTGAAATEARLKEVQGPQLLHIATHGLWLRDAEPVALDSTRQAFATMEPSPSLAPVADPMLRSGLALAGFNTRTSGMDDGFLTALEVASLNLHGTQLVVLSACDTGLGEVKSGQGVYGLRRALVVAGAQTQVMSLWKVDDTVTRDLMLAYYERLVAGEGRSEALRQAQRALLRDQATAHPYYWASFLAAGDPSPMQGLQARSQGRMLGWGPLSAARSDLANPWGALVGGLAILAVILLLWRRQRRMGS